MIDKATATTLARQYLATSPEKDGSGWDVLEERTEELDEMWLLFWHLKVLIAAGGRLPGLVGNCPILVDKKDGTLYAWTMLERLEPLLKRFRRDKSVLPRLIPDSAARSPGTPS
jgi:hypothetical protein